MRFILLKPVLVYFSFALILTGCKEQENKPQTSKSETIATDSTKTIISAGSDMTVPALPAVTDSGKPYFKVAVYKNNRPLVSYEGDWAIAISNGNNFNIQFASSKRALKISDLLILYFNGASTGTFPLVAYGNEKGKPTLIFTPELNGSYGIGVSAFTGSVVISKYSTEAVSGTIDAEGKNENGEVVQVKAAFVNVRNNNVGE